MRTFIALVICLCAVSSIHAQASLPLNILSKPLHIGDTLQKDMGSPNPDAATFQAKFQWSGGMVGDLFLIVNVSHLVSKTSGDFQKGFYQTSVCLNGQEIGILNKELKAKTESAKPETVAMPLKASMLVKGENMLEIKPGAKDGDLDDMELHSVSLDSKKPR